MQCLAAEVLANRGRTSTRGGILKAEAAVRNAEILADSEVRTLIDAAALLGDPPGSRRSKGVSVQFLATELTMSDWAICGCSAATTIT